MSAICVVTGPGASLQIAKAMAAAAPHRGAVTSEVSGDGFAAVAQNLEKQPPVAQSAVALVGDLLVAGNGALFHGPSVTAAADSLHTIAAAATESGDALLRLSGSFVAVVVDVGRNRVVAARTLEGARPLHYRKVPGGFAFAAEAKQLRISGFPRATVDMNALLDLIALGYDSQAWTPFRDIDVIEPNSAQTWQGDATTTSRGFDIAKALERSPMRFGDAVAQMSEHLTTALRRQMVENAPLLMSGGLDSSSVAALAAPLHQSQYGSRLRTITACYPDQPAADERRFAAATAGALGLDAKFVEPHPETFADLMERAWMHDGPDLAPMSRNLQQLLRLGGVATQGVYMEALAGDLAYGVEARLADHLLRDREVIRALRFAGFISKRKQVATRWGLRRIILPAVLDLMPGIARALRSRRTTGQPRPGYADWVESELAQRLAQRRVDSWRGTRIRGFVRYLAGGCDVGGRGGLESGAVALDPFADPDLIAFAASLRAAVLYDDGRTKAVARAVAAAAPVAVPAVVCNRIDKTYGDAVAASGTFDVEAHVNKAPHLLPGVAWDRLATACAQGRLQTFDTMLLQRILTADHFLAST